MVMNTKRPLMKISPEMWKKCMMYKTEVLVNTGKRITMEEAFKIILGRQK